MDVVKVTKVCSKCKIEKSVNEFNKNRWKKDGLQHACKKCLATYGKQYQKLNKDKIRNYQAQYHNENKERLSERKVEYYQENREAIRAYQSSERGRAIARESVNRSHRLRPTTATARSLVSNSIKSGKLIRPSTCSSCNTACKPEAHHCDYNKPLDVMWLCKSCHVAWHKNNTPIYPEGEVPVSKLHLI